MSKKTKKTEKLVEVICVWLDGNKWIVSRDNLGEDGKDVTSRTIEVCDTEDEALIAGRFEATRANLPLCSNDSGGFPEEIASAELLQMEELLRGYGSLFTGNSATDMASDWLDQGFTADNAGEWCEIGVWNPEIAGEFRDSGYSPRQIATAAEWLKEEDGDVIYDACNYTYPAVAIIDEAESANN